MSKPKAKQSTLFQSWGSQSKSKQNDQNKKSGAGSSGLFQTYGSSRQHHLGSKFSSTSEASSSTKQDTDRLIGHGDVIDLCDDEDDDALLSMALDEGMQNFSSSQEITSGPSKKTSTLVKNSNNLFQVFGQNNRTNQKSSTTSNGQNFQGEKRGTSPHSAEDPSDACNLSLGAEDIDATLSQCRNLEDLTGFDLNAGRLWIYPTNYPMREYQFNIVQQALFKNTMVTLPTGLGKTFIAAVVMYNFYRWYPEGKVIFMAPTKPLVAQQIEACYDIMGIPKRVTAVMTGTMPPTERRQAWRDKRVFFLTPQILTNDLSRGTCQATSIKCLVVDEAHKASGNHAYCQVVREIVKYTREFRILALSATPGSDIQSVQLVLNNLLISHIELRTEESQDIKPYTHERKVEKIVIPLSGELCAVKAKYLQVLEVVVGRLKRMQVLYNRDVGSLSKFLILKAREAFRQNPPQGLQPSHFGTVEGDFALAMSLYHGFELLQLHGLRSLYNFLTAIINGEKGYSRTKTELLRNAIFSEIMEELREKYCVSPEGSSQKQVKNFVASHPKMEKLETILLEHFTKFQDEGGSSRVMIFSQYRDSVKEITDMLTRHRPLIKVMSFIGHSAGRSSKGLTQKEQLKVMREFREGGYNTLVSTCVGEEGLDIGDVDLIICFDAHKSPVRLVQRMGRTGRKREGRIVMLVTEGKEENVYNQSQYSKRSIHRAILNGARSLHFYLHNARMVPESIKPVCHKMHITIAPDPPPRQSVAKRKSTGQRRLTDLVTAKKSCEPGRDVADDGILTLSEYKELCANYSVADSSVRTLPRRQDFCCLANPKQLSEEPPSAGRVHGAKELSLMEWLPWQNRLQETHFLPHTARSHHLVELMEFTELQQALGNDEDNYGIEMSMFLNEEDVLKPGERDLPETGILKFCVANANLTSAAPAPSGSLSSRAPSTAGVTTRGQGRGSGPAARGKTARRKKKARANVIASDSSEDDLPDFDLGVEPKTDKPEDKTSGEETPWTLVAKQSLGGQSLPASSKGRGKRKGKVPSQGKKSPALVKVIQIDDDDDEADFEGMDFTGDKTDSCSNVQDVHSADVGNLDLAQQTSSVHKAKMDTTGGDKMDFQLNFSVPEPSVSSCEPQKMLTSAEKESEPGNDVSLFQLDPSLDATLLSAGPRLCLVPSPPPLEQVSHLCGSLTSEELSSLDLPSLVKKWDVEWRERTSEVLRCSAGTSAAETKETRSKDDDASSFHLQSFFEDEECGASDAQLSATASGSPVFHTSKSETRTRTTGASELVNQKNTPVSVSKEWRTGTLDQMMDRSDGDSQLVPKCGSSPIAAAKTMASAESSACACSILESCPRSTVGLDSKLDAEIAGEEDTVSNNDLQSLSPAPVLPSLPNFDLDADSFFADDDTGDWELLNAIETPEVTHKTSCSALSSSSRNPRSQELRGRLSTDVTPRLLVGGRNVVTSDSDVIPSCDTPNLPESSSQPRPQSPVFSTTALSTHSSLTLENSSSKDRVPVFQKAAELMTVKVDRPSGSERCASPVFPGGEENCGSEHCDNKDATVTSGQGDLEEEADLCLLPQFDLGFDLDDDIVPPSPCAMSSMSQRSRASLSQRPVRLSFEGSCRARDGQSEGSRQCSSLSQTSLGGLSSRLRKNHGQDIFTKFASTCVSPIIEKEEEDELECESASVMPFQNEKNGENHSSTGVVQKSSPAAALKLLKPRGKENPACEHPCDEHSTSDPFDGSNHSPSACDISNSQGFVHGEARTGTDSRLTVSLASSTSSGTVPVTSKTWSPIAHSPSGRTQTGQTVLSSTPKRGTLQTLNRVSPQTPGGSKGNLALSPQTVNDVVVVEENDDACHLEGSKSDSDESFEVRGKRKAAVLESSDDSFSPCEKTIDTPFKTPLKPVQKKRKITTISDDEDFETDTGVQNRHRTSVVTSFLVDEDEDDFADESVRFTKVIPKKNAVKLKKKRPACAFLDAEAELSDEDEVAVSADESDTSDLEDLEGFIDNATQAQNTEVHAMYLQSVTSPVRRGGQYRLQYNVRDDVDIYSQLPCEEQTEYLEDSFCIADHTESEEDMVSAEGEVTPDKRLLVSSRPSRRRRNQLRKLETKGVKGKRRIMQLADSSSEEEEVILSPAPTQVMPETRAAALRKRKVIFSSSEDEGVSAQTDCTSIISQENSERVPQISATSKDRNFNARSAGVCERSGDDVTSVDNYVNEVSADTAADKADRKGGESGCGDTASSPVLAQGAADDCSLSIGNVSPPTAGRPLHSLSREERLRIQKQKQQEFRLKMATKNQGKGGPEFRRSAQETSPNQTLPEKVQSADVRYAALTPRQRGQPVVLVDSKEVSGAQEVISALRLTHSLTVTARQLVAADYVVSNRMAVDRRTWSDFSNGSNRSKIVERIQKMRGLHERSCLIIETDKVKPGETKPAKLSQSTKYVNSMLAHLTQVNMKVFFTQSQGETAAILAELCQQEVKKGMLISMPTSFSSTQEQVFKFYASIPKMNSINAVNLTLNFRSIKEFMNSSPDTMALRGLFSLKRAQEVWAYVRHRFDLQMTPLKKL